MQGDISQGHGSVGGVRGAAVSTGDGCTRANPRDQVRFHGRCQACGGGWKERWGSVDAGRGMETAQ